MAGFVRKNDSAESVNYSLLPVRLVAAVSDSPGRRRHLGPGLPGPAPDAPPPRTFPYSGRILRPIQSIPDLNSSATAESQHPLGGCGMLSRGRSKPSGHDRRLYASVDARESVSPKGIPGRQARELVGCTAPPPRLAAGSAMSGGVQRSVAVTKGWAASWRVGYRIGATSRPSRRFCRRWTA